MERHGEILRPENPVEIRDGRVAEIEEYNKIQIIWESYLSYCSSASSSPRGASVAEKEIGPPGMGSPIGKRRVMTEGSSSDGRSFIVNYDDLQLHTLRAFQTDTLVGNDVSGFGFGIAAVSG